MKSDDLKNHYHSALDGLRGIAALVVVLFHMDSFVGTLTSPTGGYSQRSAIWQAYRRLLDRNFSVYVFFVLSGFVLLAAYNKKREKA